MSERFERAPQPIEPESDPAEIEQSFSPEAELSPEVLENSGLSRRKFLEMAGTAAIGLGLSMSPDSLEAQTPDTERPDDGFMASEILPVLFGPEALVGNTARRLTEILDSKHPISVYAKKMTEDTEKQRDVMIVKIKKLTTKKEGRAAAKEFREQYEQFVLLNKFGNQTNRLLQSLVQ